MHTKPGTLKTAIAAPSIDEPSELGRGTVVDRFVVLETLGVGGMGVVYAAHDPELDRKVALKLLLPRAGGSAGGDTTRLMREGQALAKLSHPNVVAVHDVGTHGDRVWIAMEFVAGQTLAAWAKERPRRWSEVLAVLADVARGMAAAHGAGLVHRDLKPDNVMIGRDGRVRVMDFGLAHGRGVTMTESELASTLVSGTDTPPEPTPLGLRLTAQGAVQGTPAYMAPEQWQGQEEEAATDQFGWSVMAWEMLHGERPFAGETKVALAAAVLSGERRPPPRGHGVPVWLRRVIERGLATKPAGRWPTMLALLSALERGKTRARLRMGVAALASVALLGAGAEGYRRWDIAQRVSVCEMRGAEIDKVWNDDARQQLRDAFVATGVSYATTSVEKVMPWLDKQAGAWQEARTEVCLNADVRNVWDEDLVDRAMWCLEDRQMEIESLVAELVRADRTAVQKAVTAVASLRTAKPCLDEGMLLRQPTPPLQGREAIRDVRAMLSRADSLALAGNYEKALAVATQAREQAATLDWPPLLASACALEGKRLEETGAYEAAEMASTQAYFEAARSGAWNIAARSAIDLVYTVGYKRARHGDGRVWAQHADVALAHTGGQTGLFKARSFGNLAIVHHVTGAYADARALFERALYVHEQELGLDHPGLAGPLNNLANSHFSTGEYVQARTLHERALSIQEQALGAGHPDVAISLGNLANVYRAEGDYSVAKILRERALAIQEQALGPGHPVVAETLFSLANLADDVGANGEAQVLFRRALAIQEQSLGYEHSSVAKTLNDLAGVFIRSGAYAEARALLERARVIWVKNQGPDHPYVAMTLGNIASCYLEEQRPQDALPLLENALAIFDVHEGEQEGEIMVHFDHARALLATGGERARAVAEARKARDRLRQVDPDNANPNSVNVASDLDQWLAEHERNPAGKREQQ